MKPYIAFIEQLEKNADPAAYGVYPASLSEANGAVYYMADDGGADVIVAVGDTNTFSGETGEAFGFRYSVAPCDHGTAAALRKLFPYTAPSPVLKAPFTFGVGDRLGIATPGHIRVFEQYGGKPVFAQQSIRELNLTNRTYDNVLDAATFAVFQQGYKGGFGADGDHLKTPEEIRYALSSGYTMVTLDCSEHIKNEYNGMTDEEISAVYRPDPALEERYIGKTFDVGGVLLTFTARDFRRMFLIYGEAIDFAARMYHEFFTGQNAPDFEVSIDETSTPTTPLQHYFIANELISRGVKIATVAPRFCGEFQKGVDYRGDLRQFEQEYAAHTAIAEHFGYKLSVHSGSDKFSVFPIVGRVSKLRVHVKTAGTNWLEAMRVVAMKDPALYREIHKFALSRFAEAKKFYHVTTNLERIPDVDKLSDAELCDLFEQDDARQLIHITYGFILNEKDESGAFRFRDKLFSLWRRERAAYYERLSAHIGKHMALLQSEAEL